MSNSGLFSQTCMLVWNWRWNSLTARCLPPFCSAFPQCHSHARIQKNDAIQRRMLRSIAGWARFPNESWRDTVVKMKMKGKYALALRPVPDWSRQWAKRQYNLARQIAVTDSWAQRSSGASPWTVGKAVLNANPEATWTACTKIKFSRNT